MWVGVEGGGDDFLNSVEGGVEGVGLGLFGCSLPMFVYPAFFVVQLCMAVKTIYSTLIGFDLQ